MEPPKAPDRMTAILSAQRNALVNRFVQQAQATIPAYAAVPLVMLTPQLGLLVDTIFAALRDHDPSIMTRYLDQATRSRIEHGFPVESQIALSGLIEAILREAVTHAFAADPPLLAQSLHRLETLANIGRNAVGRILLSTLMPPPE
ncbi:MAG: hypothetical protein M3Z04_24020 [Chloroflexota bacterium]|nr:hypothetical protein [Chloroflexota bacterium]